MLHKGFHALVSSWGQMVETTDPNTGEPTTVWPEGFHQAECWVGVSTAPQTMLTVDSLTGMGMQVSHLITKQAVIFDAPCRGVPTRDNVIINIDVAITLKVTDDPILVRPRHTARSTHSLVTIVGDW